MDIGHAKLPKGFAQRLLTVTASIDPRDRHPQTLAPLLFMPTTTPPPPSPRLQKQKGPNEWHDVVLLTIHYPSIAAMCVLYALGMHASMHSKPPPSIHPHMHPCTPATIPCRADSTDCSGRGFSSLIRFLAALSS
ncbi:hypothetical protein CDAR_526771 [Caerostris darwini]|uniref:Uncharacterized protein n=1 Tax=Caerostris darwini TaxID=1538125 RepID=A0AAV4Q2N1_9ARAC|nr:hypothetical protein CDAR_526771 [Caerostris darwini]